MKSQAYILLTALFTSFVLTKGATTNFRASINNAMFGETPTEIRFTFTTGAIAAQTSSHTIVIKTRPAGALWAAAASAGCVMTKDSDASNVALTSAVTASSSSNFDILTLDPSADVAAGGYTVECKSNIPPNPTSYKEWRFDITNSGESGTEPTDLLGFAIGSPRIYFLRSECKLQGLMAGAYEEATKEKKPHTMDRDVAKYCTGQKAFVVSTGLEWIGGDDGECLSNLLTKIRCDAMYHTESSVDIAVSTSGNHGTLTCGALTKTTAHADPPTYNLMQEPENNNEIKAANSVFVPLAEKNIDHVVTLSGLTSNTQYDIYCHMDEVYMSPYLTVWTDENNRIWDDSLLPGVITKNESPGTLTLSFRHGKELSQSANADIIKLSITQDAGTTIMTSGVPVCTATTDGSVLTLGTISRANDLGTDDLILFPLGTGATSARGSKIVITCNGQNIADNPNPGFVKYKLYIDGTSDDPPALLNRFGWKTST